MLPEFFNREIWCLESWKSSEFEPRQTKLFQRKTLSNISIQWRQIVSSNGDKLFQRKTLSNISNDKHNILFHSMETNYNLIYLHWTQGLFGEKSTFNFPFELASNAYHLWIHCNSYLVDTHSNSTTGNGIWSQTDWECEAGL